MYIEGERTTTRKRVRHMNKDELNTKKLEIDTNTLQELVTEYINTQEHFTHDQEETLTNFTMWVDKVCTHPSDVYCSNCES
jgi:hypothetical protein